MATLLLLRCDLHRNRCAARLYSDWRRPPCQRVALDDARGKIYPRLAARNTVEL